MTSARRTALILASAVACVTLPHGPTRVVAALWFVLGCPGVALAPLLPPVAPASAVALALGVGAAVAALVTTALLVLGWFSAAAGLVALAAVCLGACALDWARDLRARGPDAIVVVRR